MKRALVFSTPEEAAAAISRLDVALGYPSDGVDVGGGIHAPRATSRTLTASAAVRATKRAEWAVPLDDSAERAADADPVLSAAAKAPDLDTWDHDRPKGQP